MEPLLVGPPDAGLSIQELSHDSSGVAESALVRVTMEGLRAETWVWAYEGHGFDGLVGFFSQMTEDWRGWRGERRWSSLEGDLTLIAQHHGHVILGVTLIDSVNWSVTTDFSLEPGEELSRVSQGLADLFA